MNYSFTFMPPLAGAVGKADWGWSQTESSPDHPPALRATSRQREVENSDSGPSQRLPHDVAMPVDHLRHESIHHVALQVHPFHVQGLVLRLAVAGNGHHVTHAIACWRGS